MRIQLLTHSFGPEVSPPQRRWYAFVETFLNEGVDVDVVAPNRYGRRAWHPFSHLDVEVGPGRFRLLTFPFKMNASRWSTKVLAHFAMVLFMVPKSLVALRPDLVVVTVPALPTLIAGYIVSKLRRVPLVVEMRDAWPELLEESGIIRWKLAERVSVWVIRGIQSSASLVVAVTPGHAKRLVDDGIETVSTVSNGYSFASLPRMKSHQSNCDSKLRVLYLGNLGESQGLEHVLDIAAVSQEWLDLRIVGRGSALSRLQNRATELGLSGIFVPSVKSEGVLEWYDWADTCLVSLRDDWESFEYTVPSKLFELAGYGCHITGLVRGEAADLISEYRLGTSVGGDVLGISRTLGELSNEIKGWKFDREALEAFKSKYDLESLALDYHLLLSEHLSNLREGRK
ncbi:glycosyltransferase family 4 protein [Paeniglutamicibacter sp. MACA_103]|uniref:glycosyltransferase family 4 protein n=1 Tax=Paeniglutamicibacter sp. MACA_103 TaxID=3377337 RepID=UPI003894B469